MSCPDRQLNPQTTSMSALTQYRVYVTGAYWRRDLKVYNTKAKALKKAEKFTTSDLPIDWACEPFKVWVEEVEFDENGSLYAFEEIYQRCL